MAIWVSKSFNSPGWPLTCSGRVGKLVLQPHIPWALTGLLSIAMPSWGCCLPRVTSHSIQCGMVKNTGLRIRQTWDQIQVLSPLFVLCKPGELAWPLSASTCSSLKGDRNPVLFSQGQQTDVGGDEVTQVRHFTWVWAQRGVPGVCISLPTLL